jgi:hypothetical protein
MVDATPTRYANRVSWPMGMPQGVIRFEVDLHSEIVRCQSLRA